MAPLEKVALALSDPIRLRILDLLAAGRDDACCSPDNPDAPVGLCSCDLLPVLELAPSRLSYHMKELREAGLITEQKRGRWVYFSLEPSVLSAFTRALHERFVVPHETTYAACCSEPTLIHLDVSALDKGEK